MEPNTEGGGGEMQGKQHVIRAEIREDGKNVEGLKGEGEEFKPDVRAHMKRMT